MSRTFVIGDIHGALIALRQAISKADLHAGDQLIFLGDYIDGWPESAGVIDCLIDLEAVYNCIFIRGNHDVLCQAWLEGKGISEQWLNLRGQSAIDSYEGYSPEQKAQHLAFFRRMRNYYIDGHNRLLVHAGFTSMKGPEQEEYEMKYWTDRTLLETAMALGKDLVKGSDRYPKRLLLFNEIYIGHTPTLYYGSTTPVQAANLWSMDTGAATSGSITVMNIDTKEFWQSDRPADMYSA